MTCQKILLHSHVLVCEKPHTCHESCFFFYTKALKLLKGEMKNIDQMGNRTYWQLCRCYFDIHHPPKYWWRPSTLWHFKWTPRWHWSQATVQCILLRSDALTLLQTTQTPSWVVPKQAKDRNPQTTGPKVAAVNLLALDAPGHTGMSYVYTPMNMICFFDTRGGGLHSICPVVFPHASRPHRLACGFLGAQRSKLGHRISNVDHQCKPAIQLPTQHPCCR